MKRVILFHSFTKKEEFGRGFLSIRRVKNLLQAMKDMLHYLTSPQIELWGPEKLSTSDIQMLTNIGASIDVVSWKEKKELNMHIGCKCKQGLSQETKKIYNDITQSAMKNIIIVGDGCLINQLSQMLIGEKTRTNFAAGCYAVFDVEEQDILIRGSLQ